MLLRNQDVDVDAKNEHGVTALTLACRGGHAEGVALLLFRGRSPT